MQKEDVDSGVEKENEENIGHVLVSHLYLTPIKLRFSFLEVELFDTFL